jgi:outer membrane protein assembly factor BamB
MRTLAALFLLAPLQDAPPPKNLWKMPTRAPSFGSGAAADIDGDGKLEIVFGTYFNDEHLYAVNAEDGSVLWKRKSEGGPLDASVAIVDLDGDRKPEILAADSSTGTLFCIGGDGKDRWTLKLPNSTDSPPAVGDLDGDGVLEIVVGSMWKRNGSGDLSVFRADTRKLVWSREIRGCVQSEPCLIDLDGDGKLEVIAASWRGDNAVHAFAHDGKELWTFETMDRDDDRGRHLGMYHGVTAGRIEKGGPIRIALGTCSSNRGTLFVLDAGGKLAWKERLGEYLFAPTAMADLDSDGRMEILAFGSNSHAFTADGRRLWKAPVGTLRGPAIADVDGDGDLDLVMATHDRKAVALDGPTGRTLWSVDLTCGRDRREEANSAPLIADFDGDGALDFFVVSGKGSSDRTRADNYGCAWCFRIGPGRGEWTTFRGGPRRTGVAPSIERY